MPGPATAAPELAAAQAFCSSSAHCTGVYDPACGAGGPTAAFTYCGGAHFRRARGGASGCVFRKKPDNSNWCSALRGSIVVLEYVVPLFLSLCEAPLTCP